MQRLVMLSNLPCLDEEERANRRIRQPVACVNPVVLPLFPSDVSTELPVNLEAHCFACKHHPARVTALLADISPEPRVKSGYVQL